MKIDIQVIENTVLSTFLFDNTTFYEYSYSLNEDDFYLPHTKNVFATMQYLHENDLPIEETFLIKYCNKDKVNEQNIIQLMTTTAISNVVKYIDIIREESTKRKLLSLSTEIQKEVVNDNSNIEDLKTHIVKFIDNMDKENIDSYEHKNIDIINKIKQQMENAVNNKKAIKYNTGLKSLDNILDGVDDGDLVVIAARPSMGKTSLISSICIESINNNQGVLIESLEMPADKILKRLLSVHSGENLSNIKNGVIKDIDKFNKSINFFDTEHLIIHDETYPPLYKLQSRIKRTLRKNPNIKNIFIDHTGKIQLEGKTREDIEIGHITNSLKKIARDFNLRIYLLQQLNRGVENRENKRPSLSDIKNSGNVEEDADIVLGLYRHSYYKTKDAEKKEDEQEEAEIIILKNRDGALGTAKVWFEKKTTSFKNKTTFNRNSIINFNK